MSFMGEKAAREVLAEQGIDVDNPGGGSIMGAKAAHEQAATLGYDLVDLAGAGMRDTLPAGYAVPALAEAFRQPPRSDAFFEGHKIGMPFFHQEPIRKLDGSGSLVRSLAGTQKKLVAERNGFLSLVEETQAFSLVEEWTGSLAPSAKGVSYSPPETPEEFEQKKARLGVILPSEAIETMKPSPGGYYQRRTAFMVHASIILRITPEDDEIAMVEQAAGAVLNMIEWAALFGRIEPSSHRCAFDGLLAQLAGGAAERIDCGGGLLGVPEVDRAAEAIANRCGFADTLLIGHPAAQPRPMDPPFRGASIKAIDTCVGEVLVHYLPQLGDKAVLMQRDPEVLSLRTHTPLCVRDLAVEEGSKLVLISWAGGLPVFAPSKMAVFENFGDFGI